MFDKNEYQVAGQSMAAFINDMLPYIEQGFLPDADTATHYWPSTFVVTVTKQQESVQEQATKPARKQQQKVVDKQG